MRDPQVTHSRTQHEARLVKHFYDNVDSWNRNQRTDTHVPADETHASSMKRNCIQILSLANVLSYVERTLSKEYVAALYSSLGWLRDLISSASAGKD